MAYPRRRAPAMPTAPTIEKLSYNWWTDRGSAPVMAIVAHNTVGTDSRAYLSRGGDVADGSDRKVSIHSLISKDGTLYRYVPDERGANHAGFGKMPAGMPALNPNRVTIGFELENASDGKKRVDPYTDVQLLTMGWEINRIRAKYGHLPILRHGDIDPTRRKDPVGLSVEQMEVWARKAKEYFALPPVPPTDPWEAWGPIGKPTGAATGFAVPRAWLVNKRLGACVIPETYSLSGKYSVTEFQAGVIVYFKARGETKVELF